uniref:deoxyhypusine synthase n=1 Tax=Lepeophtheirus salmonis TaxID=72036 RepID=C1BTR6_LEPSM|nr:Probable deoxyhypusine synthase [Lepeophtheirus salmonis]
MNTGIDTRTTEETVLLKSEPMPKDSQEVEGYDFNKGLDYHALLQSYKSSGFQATNFGLGVDVINNMITCRNEKMPEEKEADVQSVPRIDENYKWDPRPRRNCTIFLGYTSNMASCGVRECIRYLVEHSMVDVIVASAGGIEEDFIKCLAPTYIGDFSLDGKTLRKKGINRIGNLLVPNDNYCKFEDWIMPIFDQMLLDQKEKGIVWTPSRIIHRLGLEINDPKSIYYWAAKNNIPVFSPALTDGSIGDMLYFHSIKKPGLVVDILQDLRSINDMSVKAVNTGMIIVGGGLIKHHICNSNLMRNGANFSIFLNVANEFDGSDSGARPDEAISWGKIRMDAKPVKIYGEATLIFPLLMAETFVRTHLKL